jgi:formylmethanofuran dehydrogenase subunit E
MSGGTKQVQKICCKCDKDVAGSPRVKDKAGQYWCIPCSEADKLHTIHVEAGICEGCGEAVGRTQLVQITGQSLCPKCRERRFKFRISTPNRHNDGASIISSIKSLFGK